MIGKNEVKQYLLVVCELVRKGQYHIERNENREANDALFLNYLIDERKAAEIITQLEVNNFCGRVEDRSLQSSEMLYIFGRNVTLQKRFEDGFDEVELYIKLKKTKNHFVVVISFHESKYPMEYYFEK